MGIGRQRPPVPGPSASPQTRRSPPGLPELGTPVSPQHAAVLLDRRGLGSPAQHARLPNVPRDTGDKAVLLDCRRLGGSVCPSKVHRRVPKPDAVPLDCRELGTPCQLHPIVLNTTPCRPKTDKPEIPTWTGLGPHRQRHHYVSAPFLRAKGSEGREHERESERESESEQERVPN
ncbi:hypothetical protein D4764_07G0000020 [Takifugu flavidus]|uniref:Uncharacterized protein n=1 Tax=Takifugu flavidus TaxID=433684 RepID=A0A5C6MQT7_9TELE|nr:hypothetical protein D4764_07G0000020 [Takifugu flavidus]